MLDLGGRRSGETSLIAGTGSGSKNKDYGEGIGSTTDRGHGHQIVKTA